MKSPLREERERRGWTLDFVAQKVGVTAATVSRIENEGVKAADTAREIAKLFGTVSLDQICCPEAYMLQSNLEKVS